MNSEHYILCELSSMLNNAIAFTESLASNTADQNSAALLTFRNRVRNELTLIQNRLIPLYGDKVASYIIFPQVALIDERCKIAIAQSQQGLTWTNLQIEFFQINNGGEYVFDVIEEVVRNRIYPRLAYESLLLVLNQGFLGKYYDNPNHAELFNCIHQLKQRLNEIVQESPAPTREHTRSMSSRSSGGWIQYGGYMATAAILIPIALFFAF
ncbi:DotU family type IV/VI secretion system protein [Vibrio marisflavi]|uniref:Type IV / VI secretion system DotU domain-containing protein n=1 Tax=Vibrio marisflavi CECT 7928 TaxID=634439 RepID=A0ABN8E175_9VIBR|nr:DotU family type IV/VI secretion system protein [Vibrio marisflavi]CAH0538618.1 hypothetical protein VMF7928_01549 [Vibrio marisflavi CECT 7928]